MLLLVIYILLIGCIVLLGYSFYKKEDALKLPLRHKEELEDKIWQAEDKPGKRFPLTLILAPLNKILLNASPKMRKEMENKLFFSELNLSAEDFMGMKEIMIAVLFFITFSVMNKLTTVTVAIPLLAGYILPDFMLNNTIQKKKKLILRVFPDTIDLINLCVDAGLDFMQGLRWVVERTKPNPLTREFSRIVKEVKMGLSRQEALKNMAKRLNMPEINSFVSALIHADRMGAQINQVLSVISEETRRQKFEKAERIALKAPVKMLFPLIFFILPVIGIIVGGPVMIQFMTQGLPTTSVK
jgi:tight adherence protein C